MDAVFECAELAQRDRMYSMYESLRESRPRTRRQLRDYVQSFLGIGVPDKSFCEGHVSPLDYLWHVFGVDFQSRPKRRNGDVIVWANRGGSKTLLGAVATLLDCVFKPGCQVRILGGSQEQSSRMYEYLLRFVECGFEYLLAAEPTANKCEFVNGSRVELLTQSARSVRGRHVQKLRCDEVELFDREVFEAAKFITQSKDGVRAGMELLSTMHRPYGLMQEAVRVARKHETPVMQWCMWEVIENCRGRVCSRCPLWGYCGGKAKKASGYLSVDDCITQMRRSSKAGFETEMLCMRPSLDQVVFAEFDVDSHVREVDYNPQLPLYRAIDFGFVNPFVCLWVQVDASGCVHVIDEYSARRKVVGVHAQEILRRTPCEEQMVAGTYCDPAGAGRNDVTGTSAICDLRAAGIRTAYRHTSVLEGIELIRRALVSGDGRRNLIISPKCLKLIEALGCYHYSDSVSIPSEIPEKDGLYDHWIDALRYFFVNWSPSGTEKSIRY